MGEHIIVYAAWTISKQLPMIDIAGKQHLICTGRQGKSVPLLRHNCKTVVVKTPCGQPCFGTMHACSGLQEQMMISLSSLLVRRGTMFQGNPLGTSTL